MHTLIAAAIGCSLLFVLPTITYGISAQWNLNLVSGDSNAVENWTPTTISNGLGLAWVVISATKP